jgi:hypothetical protein
MWAEELPNGCPPKDAVVPNNATFFRLVNSLPPTIQDFHSQRKLNPTKTYNTSECRALSCSLYTSKVECSKLLLLPTHLEQKMVKIVLPPSSGVIKKSGNSDFHYSWWRYLDFDPFTCCEEV